MGRCVGVPVQSRTVGARECLEGNNLKTAIAKVPGSLVAYKIVKNLSHRLPRERVGIGTIRANGMDQSTAVAYIREVFEKIDKAVLATGEWSGRDVLQIDPGDSLAFGLLAIAQGARSYTAIERSTVAFDDAFERRLFGELVESMSPEQRERVASVVELDDNGYRADEKRFRHIHPCSIEEALVRFGAGSFDTIFSNGALTTVVNVPGALAAMHGLLSPRGVMFHDVDQSSLQRIQKHELQFLEYSDPLWRAMTSHGTEPNRVRLPEYATLLDAAGFVDVVMDIRDHFDPELVARVKPRLARRFRNIPDDELGVSLFRFTARVP